MADFMCYNCKTFTEIHEDYNNGDSVCTECGFVLESSIIDDRPEWRNFEGEQTNSQTRADRAPSTNYSSDLHTQISNNRGGEKNLEILQTNKRFGNIENNTYKEGFEIISNMVERLQLVKTIEDHAMEIYKKMGDANFLNGRNHTVVAASCLYLSCGLENNSRTLNEIASSAIDAIQPCDISRTSKKINKKLEELGEETTNQGEADVTIFVRRFCSKLQLPNNEVKAILETMKNLKNYDIRRKPNSVLAAAIFMVNQMSSEKRDLKEIALATSVGEVTIASVYKYILPFQSEIVPKWFFSSPKNGSLSNAKIGSSIATNQNKIGPVKTTFFKPKVNSPVGTFKSLIVPNKIPSLPKSSFLNPNMSFQHITTQNEIFWNRFPIPVKSGFSIPTISFPPQTIKQQIVPNRWPCPIYCSFSNPTISFPPQINQNQIVPNGYPSPVANSNSNPRIDYPPDLRKKKIVQERLPGPVKLNPQISFSLSQNKVF